MLTLLLIGVALYLIVSFVFALLPIVFYVVWLGFLFSIAWYLFSLFVPGNAAIVLALLAVFLIHRK